MSDNREREQAEEYIDRLTLVVEVFRTAINKLTKGMTIEEKQELISSCVAEVYDTLDLEEND